MIHRSTIQLKGKDKLIIVSKAAALEVAKVWGDKSIDADHSFNIKNQQFFRKGEIKNIEVLSDMDKPAWEEKMADFYEKERIGRIEYLKRTPAQKAQDLGMFELLYRSAMGELPSSELLSQARSIQERFFVANPKRTMCDPSQLTRLIPLVRGKKVGLFAVGAVGIVERAVSRDMQLSR